MLAALIDKQPLPDQQWQISVSFTDEAKDWKQKMDEFIKASPEEVKNKFQLEATIMRFLFSNGFMPVSRDFFVKK